MRGGHRIAGTLLLALTTGCAQGGEDPRAAIDIDALSDRIATRTADQLIEKLVDPGDRRRVLFTADDGTYSLRADGHPGDVGYLVRQAGSDLELVVAPTTLLTLGGLSRNLTVPFDLSSPDGWGTLTLKSTGPPVSFGGCTDLEASCSFYKAQLDTTYGTSGAFGCWFVRTEVLPASQCPTGDSYSILKPGIYAISRPPTGGVLAPDPAASPPIFGFLLSGKSQGVVPAAKNGGQELFWARSGEVYPPAASGPGGSIRFKRISAGSPGGFSLSQSGGVYDCGVGAVDSPKAFFTTAGKQLIVPPDAQSNRSIAYFASNSCTTAAGCALSATGCL